MSANGSHRPSESTAGDRDSLGVFDAVFDSLSHAVLVTDEGGTIVFANPRACAIFASTPPELVGRHLSSLIHDAPAWDPAESGAGFWARLEDQPLTAPRRRPGVRKDGVLVPLEIGINTLAGGASRYLVVSLADVTERLNLEERLAVSDEQRGFQRLVADVAVRFGDVEPGMVADIMGDSLRQLGEALQVDQVVLWEWQSGRPEVRPVHAWQRESSAGVEPLSVASVPYVTSKVQSHEAYWFTTPDEIPDHADQETFRKRAILSSAMIPLVAGTPHGGNLSALSFSSFGTALEWQPATLERLRLVSGVISQALARVRTAEALTRALTEILALRDRMERLPSKHEGRVPHLSNIIAAESPAMKAVMAQIEQVTTTPATVLLLGETGTGKEVLAQTIHDLSPRHLRPMVRVSCAAIPTALMESELFGRERGAYTGALSRQIGRFEAANLSTIFLDEIGELPAEVQVKLLRVLQERVIERLGSTQPVKVDIRIIAATNRDLEKAVEEKAFREDLFYRLNVFPIVVPPLRERLEDIPVLAWAFIDEFSKNFGKTITSISKESMHELQRYTWPGNVRELRNVIERAVIVSTSPELVVAAPRPPARMPQNTMTLSALEIVHIRTVLENTHWRVRGKGGAAERLGMKPTTLESRMAKLGIMRKKAL